MHSLPLFLAAALSLAGGANRHESGDWAMSLDRAATTKVSYQSEIAVTNQIVERIRLGEGFSPAAQKLEIYTIAYIIHLQGAVASQAERDRIVHIARQEAGFIFKVVDELHVAP